MDGLWENPIKMDDLGVPLFRKHPYMSEPRGMLPTSHAASQMARAWRSNSTSLWVRFSIFTTSNSCSTNCWAKYSKIETTWASVGERSQIFTNDMDEVQSWKFKYSLICWHMLHIDTILEILTLIVLWLCHQNLKAFVRGTLPVLLRWLGNVKCVATYLRFKLSLYHLIYVVLLWQLPRIIAIAIHDIHISYIEYIEYHDHHRYLHVTGNRSSVSAEVAKHNMTPKQRRFNGSC